jgi:hypothetical protein
MTGTALASISLRATVFQSPPPSDQANMPPRDIDSLDQPGTFGGYLPDVGERTITIGAHAGNRQTAHNLRVTGMTTRD